MDFLGTDIQKLSSDICRRPGGLLASSTLFRPALMRLTLRFGGDLDQQRQRGLCLRVALCQVAKAPLGWVPGRPGAQAGDAQGQVKRCHRKETCCLCQPRLLCGQVTCTWGSSSTTLALYFPQKKAKQPHELPNTQGKQMLFSFLTQLPQIKTH